MKTVDRADTGTEKQKKAWQGLSGEKRTKG